jgi:hypothetical protein
MAMEMEGDTEGVSDDPIIPYDYYKLPYNSYLFWGEFCNATKHYQPRRMNLGISRKILHHLVCAAPFRSTYQVV